MIAMTKRPGLNRVWPQKRQRQPRASSVGVVSPEAPEFDTAEGQERETEEQEEEDESMAEEFAEEEAVISANLDLFLRAEAMGPLSHSFDPEVGGSKGGASSSSQVPTSALELVQPENPATNVGLEVFEGSASAEVPGEAAPPEAIPKAMPKAFARGQVVTAAAAVYVEGGRIAFHISKGSFEATCQVHHRCVLSRTSTGRTSRRRDGHLGGRPVGFLCCWLKAASQHRSKEDHCNKTNWAFSQAERLAARTELKALASGRDLLSHERELNADEPEEPATLAGMM